MQWGPRGVGAGAAGGGDAGGARACAAHAASDGRARAQCHGNPQDAVPCQQRGWACAAANIPVAWGRLAGCTKHYFSIPGTVLLRLFFTGTGAVLPTCPVVKQSSLCQAVLDLARKVGGNSCWCNTISFVQLACSEQPSSVHHIKAVFGGKGMNCFGVCESAGCICLLMRKALTHALNTGTLDKASRPAS